MDDFKNIPAEALFCLKTLENEGFSAYLIGGCVRDLLLKRKPRDWDITTNAKPEDIVKLFPKTVYTNDFGTVTVINKDSQEETLKAIEITPYRLEADYSDFRHPDEVSFSTNIEDDLKRRDFTINALAYNPSKGQIIDLYKGQRDLKDKVLRTVDEAKDRFQEDPLRIIRAVRIASELGFILHPETEEAAKNMASLLSKISIERIRDEFVKMIMSENPDIALKLLVKLDLVEIWLPEIKSMVGVKQNGEHIYDVWDHSLRALKHAANNDWSLEIRLAAFFHDIGKPPTRRFSKEKNDWTFYGHEVVGSRMASKILKRLKFPVKLTEKVQKLILAHMFFSDIEKITLSAVRRIINKVGAENVWDLMKLRSCDRIGMGRPKENPYRLRKYHSMIEEALRQPTSVGMLKIDGSDIMEIIKLEPGPKIGYILHALLAEVLENPELNSREYLEKRSKELASLPEKELIKLGQKGKEEKEIKEKKIIGEIRKKHGVK